MTTSPFLGGGGATLGAAVIRSLASALPTEAVAEATSPWLPRNGPAPVAASAPAIDDNALAAARAAATMEGRAAGLRETEDLRQKLGAAIAACERAAATRAAQQAELLADAAVTAIETWLGRALPDADRFAPIVRGWLAGTGDGAGATCACNPGDAAAVRAAIGDATLVVVEDKAIARGDLRIASGALELDHRWSARLAELRDAIATAFAQHEEPA